MIPFFYRRYVKAPLATFISMLSSCAFLLTVLFSVGYFFNWRGIKDEVPLQDCLIAAGCSVVAGFVLMKWAAWLAKRKYRKLAEREGTTEHQAQPAQTQASRPASEAQTSQAGQAAYQAQAAQTSRPEPERPSEAPHGASLRFCPKCGTKAEAGDAFCVNCGAKLADRASTAQADTFQAYESHTYVRQTPPQEPPAAQQPQQKQKSGAVRLLVTLVILALAFFGGRWLSEQMAKNYKTNAGETQETEETAYYTWQAPADPFEFLPTLLSVTGDYGIGWDIMGATDFVINQATLNCFSGSTADAFGALFMDATGDRGGFIYEHDKDLFAWFGSWRRTSIDPKYLTLIDTAGKGHELELEIYSNDSIRVVSAEGRAIQFNMERSDEQRANLINLMANVRDGKYS